VTSDLDPCLIGFALPSCKPVPTRNSIAIGSGETHCQEVTAGTVTVDTTDDPVTRSSGYIKVMRVAPVQVTNKSTHDRNFFHAPWIYTTIERASPDGEIDICEIVVSFSVSDYDRDDDDFRVTFEGAEIDALVPVDPLTSAELETLKQWFNENQSQAVAAIADEVKEYYA
jgi:hypothetical protein